MVRTYDKELFSKTLHERHDHTHYSNLLREIDCYDNGAFGYPDDDVYYFAVEEAIPGSSTWPWANRVGILAVPAFRKPQLQTSEEVAKEIIWSPSVDCVETEKWIHTRPWGQHPLWEMHDPTDREKEGTYFIDHLCGRPWLP